MEGNPSTLQDYYGYSTGRMQLETRQGPRPPSPGSRTADGWERHFAANPDAERPDDYRGSWPARHGPTCGQIGVMDVFRNNPAEVFPFPVKGCERLAHGSRCALEAIPLAPHGSGDVRVTSTSTSVKFTVESEGYFQGPGSTIEFTAVDRDGYIYLVKEGTVHNGEVIANLGAEAGGSSVQWSIQAENLRRALVAARAEEYE